MKFTNIKFVLVLLVLLIIIGLLGYSFYNNYNLNFNYKVQEKFEDLPSLNPMPPNFIPSKPEETEIFNKLSEYSNIMTKTAPSIVNDISGNINTILPEISSKQDYLENLANTNSVNLKIIEYSIQNDINKIKKLMDGSAILPIAKHIIPSQPTMASQSVISGPSAPLDQPKMSTETSTIIKEGFNGTPQFPIPTSIKIFEKFADTNDWRTEWNNKLLSIYNITPNSSSPKNMDPVVNTDKTEFYILKNSKLEENLNNTSSQIIKNNLDNISNKLKSQWLKNKF